MRRTYVLLRNALPARRSGPARPGIRDLNDAPEDSSRSTELSVETLDQNEVAEIGRDPHVMAAPAMRTTLIRPLDLGNRSLDDDWGLKAVGAETCVFSGKGVRVAVLDTGIDQSHEAFRGVQFSTCDFTGSGMDDRQGHGTHCAGTIFGRAVEGRRIGVAPGVDRAYVGKVLGDDGKGSSEMIFRGLMWAIEQKCDVVSLSLGLDFPGQVQDLVDMGWPADIAGSMAIEDYRKHSAVFESLAGVARAKSNFGAAPLIVAASGNESRRNDDPRHRMATSLPGVVADISVGAVEPAGASFGVAYFSNAFPTVVAPGVDIFSAKPGGGLKGLSGTSMACPHVAGVAALWAEKLRRDGETANAEVIRSHIIVRSRRDVLVPGSEESDVGRGLVTAPA